MKKIAAVVLIVFVIAGFYTGCSKKTDSGLPKIGVSMSNIDDAFISSVQSAIYDSGAAKAEIQTSDSRKSQEAQNAQVDAFIKQKVRALAVNLVEPQAAADIITKAKAEKIPVVFFNTKPADSDMKLWDQVFYVGSKPQDAGTQQGLIAADYFKKNRGADKNNDGVIQFIMLTGEIGHKDAELRTEYSIKAITGAGLKVQKLGEDTAMWSRIESQKKTEAFLAAHGSKIELILANNDDMALGAADALKAKGYNTGTAKYIPVAGIGAQQAALAAIEEKSLLGTVLNDAKNQGKAVFDIAFACAVKTPVSDTGWKIDAEKYVWIPYQMITEENAAQLK